MGWNPLEKKGEKKSNFELNKKSLHQSFGNYFWNCGSFRICSRISSRFTFSRRNSSSNIIPHNANKSYSRNKGKSPKLSLPFPTSAPGFLRLRSCSVVLVERPRICFECTRLGSLEDTASQGRSVKEGLEDYGRSDIGGWGEKWVYRRRNIKGNCIFSNFLYLQLELTIELIDIEGSRREILKPFLKIAIFERYVLYRPQNRHLTPSFQETKYNHKSRKYHSAV